MNQKIENQFAPGYSALLLVTGVLGLVASFLLTLGKLSHLENPDAVLSCNWGITVQCGANLDSWQGSLFGFPNPLVGLAAFTVPIVIAVALFAGAKFANWFWWGFLGGTAVGFIWVIWFIYQSIFDLGTLCPWCMVMWIAMIPMFWYTLFFQFKTGIIPSSKKVQKIAEELYSWAWVITLGCFVIIAIIAQLRLDVINNF